MCPKTMKWTVPPPASSNLGPGNATFAGAPTFYQTWNAWNDSTPTTPWSRSTMSSTCPRNWEVSVGWPTLIHRWSFNTITETLGNWSMPSLFPPPDNQLIPGSPDICPRYQECPQSVCALSCHRAQIHFRIWRYNGVSKSIFFRAVR